MRPLFKPRHPRWPTWAAVGDFRRRAESALTHPATVAALGVLLLNDLLFKALWPDAWVTGKLSDLAWLIFALPLLAFLLSFAARGNLHAQRLAFLAAYVGLPILYAAFNTFDPVHDWIMRGIALAGGAAGSPRDATDSLVIPLAWGAALWVWRREVPAAGAMRLRWAVLVAGVAALASVASTPQEALSGVQLVGIAENGNVLAYADYITYHSVDGGLTWSQVDVPTAEAVWGGQSVDTPRGRYALDGPHILRIDTDGGLEHLVFSTRHLEEAGNLWVQKVSTEHLGDPRELTTQPLGIAYDDRAENVVIALGLQGVVIGTPDGRWINTAVGRFEPADLSFQAKTRLLLMDLEFWAAAVTLSISMAGAALIASQHRLDELFWAIPIALAVGAVGSFLVPFLAIPFTGRVLILALLATPIVVAALPIASMPHYSARRRFASIGIGGISILAASALIILFGYSDDNHYSDDGLRFSSIAVVAWAFAISSLIVSQERLPKNWHMVVASSVGMTALVVLVFMLWLHQGVNEVLTKFSAIVLCGIAAMSLARYVGARSAAESILCPGCGKLTLTQLRRCIHCDTLLRES